jgi:two-component system, OmpR family, sensor kinase
LLFTAMFATIILLGSASVWSLSHSNEVATDVRDRWLPNVRLLGDLNNYTSDYRTAEANSLLAANSQELASSLQEFQLLDQTVQRAQRDYEKIRHGQAEAALYRDFSATWERYKAIAEQVIALSAAGRTADGAAIYRGKSRTTYVAGCEFQAPQKCLRLINVYAINFIP